jgi:hypothetical protein
VLSLDKDEIELDSLDRLETALERLLDEIELLDGTERELLLDESVETEL